MEGDLSGGGEFVDWVKGQGGNLEFVTLVKTLILDAKGVGDYNDPGNDVDDFSGGIRRRGGSTGRSF